VNTGGKLGRNKAETSQKKSDKGKEKKRWPLMAFETD